MRPLPLFCYLLLLSLSSALHAQQPAVFDLTQNAKQTTVQHRNFVTAHRPTGIDFAQFKTAQAGDALALELFNELSLKAKIQRRTEKKSGRYILTGSLSGKLTGQFTIAICDKKLAGNFRLDDGRSLQIRNTAAGYHETRLIDENQIPRCENSAAQRVNAKPSDRNINETETLELKSKGPPIVNDIGSIIDVLVVYTPAAKSAVGGEAAMTARIDLGIEETNMAYENSGIIPRVNLVHQQEISYTGASGMSTDLSRLRNKFDGYMDSVHDLRDDHHADLVSLWVDGDSCGIGYLMTTPTIGFESSAFSVCDYACATGNYTFGHEMGHNMGCDHAVGDSSPPAEQGDGLYNYSHGWRDPSNLYRTIMAYLPGSRRQLFSNPNINFPNGEPAGIPLGQPDEAYNALGINNAALTVSNFRQRPPPFDISPDETFVVEAPLNGSFTPTSKVFTITNTGTGALDWRTNFNLGWLDFVPSSGTLVTTGSVDVTVLPNFSGTVPILPAGSLWKYLDDGSDQGTAWRENDFDDSAWESGLAELGYGDGDEETVVSYGGDKNNRHITTYFRHRFTIDKASEYTNLKMRVVRDDGVVVYLNSAEVLRDNMREGRIDFDDIASAASSNSAEKTFFEFDLPGTLLMDGENVIAAEIHQRSAVSSDISFNLEFQADGPFIPGTFNGTFTFYNSTGGETIDRQIELTVLPPVEVPDINPEPDWTLGLQNTVSWNATTSATQYQLQAAQDENFSQLFFSQRLTSSTTNIEFIDLQHGQKYYYRVKAFDETGDSAWSEVVRSAQDNVAPASSVISPIGIIGTSQFLLQWQAVDPQSGVDHVIIFWSRNENPYATLATFPVAQTSVMFNSKTKGGDGSYRFYSISTDAVGNIETAPPTPDTEVTIDTSGGSGDPNINSKTSWILY